MAVRNKAIKGKGAWYWVHLEAVLVRSADTGRYEAVKLRWSLCDVVFSASNPSRTATEHLKRGTCLKFTSSAVANALSASSPKPISSIAPCSSPAATAAPHHNCKRSASSAVAPSCHVPLLAYPSRSSSSPTACTSSDVAHFATPLPLPPPQRLQSCALTMLDDSVKKKKSPKSSPVPVHSKSRTLPPYRLAVRSTPCWGMPGVILKFCSPRTQRKKYYTRNTFLSQGSMRVSTHKDVIELYLFRLSRCRSHVEGAQVFALYKYPRVDSLIVAPFHARC